MTVLQSRRAFMITALAGFTAAGCGLSANKKYERDKPAAFAKLDGLHDQWGHVVGPGYFQKPLALLYFGLIRCPLICYPDMADMNKGLQLLNPDIRRLVQPVHININHFEQAPDKLANFFDLANTSLKNRQVPEDLIVMGGGQAQIAAAARSLDVKYKVAEDGSQAMHSRLMYAIDTRSGALEHVFRLKDEQGKIDPGGHIDIEEIRAALTDIAAERNLVRVAGIEPAHHC